MSESIVKVSKDKLGKVQRFLREREKILSAVLAGQLDLERFFYLALTAVARAPKLLLAFEENPTSLYMAIYRAAQLGLEPSGATAEFALQPRQVASGKNGRRIWTVVGVPMYRGLTRLALEAGCLRIEGVNVFQGERFEQHEGTDPKLVHLPRRDIARTEETLTECYGRALLPSREWTWVVLSKERVYTHHRPAHWEKTPWKSHPLQMFRKTALLAICNSGQIPRSPKLAAAAQAVMTDGEAFDLPGGDLDSVVEEVNPPRRATGDDPWEV